MFKIQILTQKITKTWEKKVAIYKKEHSEKNRFEILKPSIHNLIQNIIIIIIS